MCEDVEKAMFNGIRWLVPDRVIVAEFSGVLHIEDFIQAREQLQQLISAQHNPSFYIIYDTTARTSMDWRFNDLMLVRDLGYRHPRLRSLVVVDTWPHPLASVVGRMAVQIHGLTLHITRTRDEAAAYLQNIDPTLRTALTQ